MKTNLTLPSYVWVGGGKPSAHWTKVPEGETLAAFLCLLGMSDCPPRRKSYFFCGSLCANRQLGIHGAGGVAQATTGI